MGRIHAATRLTPRLTRVLRVLRDGRPHTTRELIERARVCAVNTCVSEMRALGYVIECRSQGHDGHGAHVYAYQLVPRGVVDLKRLDAGVAAGDPG